MQNHIYILPKYPLTEQFLSGWKEDATKFKNQSGMSRQVQYVRTEIQLYHP